MELLPLSTSSPGKKAPDRIQPAEPRAAAKIARASAAAKTPRPAAAPAARESYQVSLDIDKRLNQVVATIKNPATGEVIEQLPPEQIRNIAVDIREKLAPMVDQRA